MKIGFLSILLAFIMIFTTGCHPAAPQQTQKVVREITVTCERSGTLTRRVYHSPEKMGKILNSLRSLGQKSTPSVDPDTLQTHTYNITLTHNDGSQRIYQAKTDRFIRRNRDPWQQADPKRVGELTALLQTLPGDEEVSLRRPFPRSLPITIQPALCILAQSRLFFTID